MENSTLYARLFMAEHLITTAFRYLIICMKPSTVFEVKGNQIIMETPDGTQSFTMTIKNQS